MKHRAGVLVLTGFIAILSVYFLSFSLISSGVQNDAAEYATDEAGNVDFAKKQVYLDSVWNEPVFNFLGLEYTYKEIKEQQLQLGLDLQGGMNVTMEVSPVEILKALAGNSTDASFIKAIETAEKMQVSSQAKFLDLFYTAWKQLEPNRKLNTIFSSAANRDRGITLTTSDAEVLKVIDDEIDSSIDRSFQILRARIDKFGVTQPNIQRIQGTGRIQLELPGVDNPERVRKLLQGVAKLEFWEVYKEEELFPVIEKVDKYLAARELEEMPATVGETKTALPTTENAEDALTAGLETEDISTVTDSLTGDIANADSTAADSLAGKVSVIVRSLRSQYALIFEMKDTAKINAAFARPDVKELLPTGMEFLWAVKAQVGDDGKEYLEMYAIRGNRNKKAPMEGDVVTDARLDIAEGKPGVSMKMNATGAQKWKRLTSQNIGRRVAIVLDNYVYSAPVVQSEIPNGNSSISGNFTVEEAKDLANILKAGKLPAPTRIVEEAIVGPNLGKEAISQGLLSCIFGLLLVVVSMVLYYNKGGWVSNLSLLFNIFFIFGVLAQFNAVLTLPGIAGIVLTIGMAVDANVLIFERIREELRAGLSTIEAIKRGFDKAFATILDSNVTTLLTAVILFLLGSGPIKGFAITLIIGIFCSFFTAFFISKEILVFMIGKKDKPNIAFSTTFSRNLFTNIQFNVIGNRKIAYIVSGAIIALGAVSIAINGLNLGVDFKGGRTYIVRFSEPVTASDIRATIADNLNNEGIEVKSYGGNNQVKITTGYLVQDESTEADAKVLTALTEGLKELERPYELMGSSKIGATIADDIMYSSYRSLGLALLGIFLYIFVRFRKWQFGLGSVVALVHDVLVVISLYAVATWAGLGVEVDQVFVAAILTIVGYSINDTVVIFDRVREYTALNPKGDLAKTINDAINSTFGRTIMTAFTVFVVVLVLFIAGGEVLRGFSFAMLLGVIFGTYSSVFIAVPIVLDLGKEQAEKALTASVKKKSGKEEAEEV